MNRCVSQLLVFVTGMLMVSGAFADATIPLLEFCTSKRPDDEQLGKFYDTECPQILQLAVTAGQNSLQTSTQQNATSTATSKAQLEKQKIDNLKALLPAGASVPAPPTGVSLDPYAHLIQLRQIKLLDEIGKPLKVALGTNGSGTVVILLQSELDQLKHSTIPPAVMLTELKNTIALIESTSRECGRKTTGGVTPKAIGPALVVADSLMGLALKISQAFQTNLMAASSGSLTRGADEIVEDSLINALLAEDEPPNIYVGLPSISSRNAIAKKLGELREAIDKLVIAMSISDANEQCVSSGKALLDTVAARLTSINASTDALTPSPLLTAMRVAEFGCLTTPLAQNVCNLDDGSNLKLIILDAVHFGGSFSAMKTAFSSQQYLLMATVGVAFRVEELDGKTIAAGVILKPMDGSVADRIQLDKNFSVSNVANKEDKKFDFNSIRQ